MYKCMNLSYVFLLDNLQNQFSFRTLRGYYIVFKTMDPILLD